MRNFVSMQYLAEDLPLKIFNACSENFNALCLEVFRFQYDNNPVYKKYCDLLNRRPQSVESFQQIPFLPIGLFKTHTIKTTGFKPRIIFESSGTTGTQTSRHFVKDPELYEQSFLRAFEMFYGKPQQYCILGLLPGYLERENSSLVYMVNKLCGLSGDKNSGFYLYDYAALSRVLEGNRINKKKTILIGVTYALIDFALQFPMDLEGTIVMETGGMKGRRKEMLRSEVHDLLTRQLKVGSVHSEYGMTELLSQAYSAGSGLFRSPPWMQVLCREEDDPLSVLPPGREAKGGANIIDLANMYSCSFIATDDLLRCHSDGSFEVEGRLDHSDMRGCNLLFAQAET